MTKKSSKKILSPLRVGNNVIIRGVTMYYTGHIEAITAKEILLSSAAWIADTGRWTEALRTGKLNEVEPYPDGLASIGVGSICDVSNWTPSLPLDVR